MYKIIIGLIVLFNVSKIYAINTDIAKTIQHEIKKTDPNVNIGIKIRNLTNGKVSYAQNEERYYNFASSLKLITLTSLYEYFGADRRFSSKILHQDDNYYLDINDPDFSTDDLDLLISNIKRKGIKKINNFYIVNEAFSVPPIRENNMIVDLNYCYAAPITKVHINKNCVKVLGRAASKAHEKIYIEPIEVVPYKIINNAITMPSSYQDRINTVINADTLIVSGTLNKTKQALMPLVAVTNDNLFHVKLMLRKLVQKHNITIGGEILYTSKPKTAKQIAEVNKDFYQLARIALKDSSNFITDYLLAEFSNIYGVDSWNKAGRLLKQLVNEKLQVDLTKAVIVDGSGLSRYNMLTVNQMDLFLTNLYKQEKSLITSLTYSGEQTRRFKGQKIFAKTGTMTGISSLVGYMVTSNNDIFSFVIVSNGYFGSKQKYAQLEEKIVNYLYENL